MTNVVYDDGTTRVYCCHITEPFSRHDKHIAERKAVEALVKDVFGPDAVYTHHPDGAPKIISRTGYGSISVSHGAGMALLAVSSAQSVGVDVEAPREQLVRVAHKFMDRPCTDIHELLREWTIKEAIYKAARTPGLPLTEIPTGNGPLELRGKKYEICTIEHPTHTIAIGWLLKLPNF